MNFIYENDFSGSYGNAKRVLEDNPFYLNLLDKFWSNDEYVSFVKLANCILGVPPVKSFLLIFQNEIKQKENGKITDSNLKQALGSWFRIFISK